MASTWPAKNNYATGDVLTATNMNGIGDDLNDLYTIAGKAAGVNAIINGDFGIWQRGTTFNSLSVSFNYLSDRFRTYRDGTAATLNCTQQTFTSGTAPVSGYEGTYFLRMQSTVAGSGGTYNVLSTPLEDVRLFAGQTVTFSFWAKADSARTIQAAINQNFGSGGSAEINAGTSSNLSVTTSWQRFSYTLTMPSVSGKTIGTSSYINVYLLMPVNTTFTLDTWGWQLEAGSTASPFQTATGTKQGELAACQRYCQVMGGQSSGNADYIATGSSASTTASYCYVTSVVPMRVTPSLTLSAAADFSLALLGVAGQPLSGLSLTSSESSPYASLLAATYTTNANFGLSKFVYLRSNSATSKLTLSAEL